MKCFSHFSMLFLCCLLNSSAYSQEACVHKDRFLDSLCIWAASDTSIIASNFHRFHPPPYQLYRQEFVDRYSVYIFPDRCSDVMVVIDTSTAKIEDVCVYRCEWLYEELKKN